MGISSGRPAAASETKKGAADLDVVQSRNSGIGSKTLFVKN